MKCSTPLATLAIVALILARVTMAQVSAPNAGVRTPMPVGVERIHIMSGANNLAGAASIVLANFFGTDEVSFSLSSTLAEVVDETRTYQRSSDAAVDIVHTRVSEGSYNRFADAEGRKQGTDIANWAYLRSPQPLVAPPRLYQLISSHSQKCLDVPEWSLTEGIPLVQWACNGGDNQAWSLDIAPDGHSRLIARHSGKCLDVSGASTDDRADIIQWQCHGGENQQWRVQAVPGGYQLIARHSGKCLDVQGESTNDGGSIIQWSCHGGANQVWLLRPAATPPAPAMSAPAPGSTLVSRTTTFHWTGFGDEFWLTIGSVPGGTDIYESGSLGQETQHTVSGLPLNGMTLYVQLHRRLGAMTDVLNVQYVAPIRKGLLVITDFADRRLEDWSGEGMNTVDEVSMQLREMEAHWAWLSRGVERIQWDIIRVTLSQSCVAGAFSDWTQFRATVAGLVRQQVAVADYDVNSDGTIDAAWLIVSAGGNLPGTGCAAEIAHWALGGSSSNGGMAMFVDGQASGSVISKATGNFNHELGHLVGLVDMYGSYDTLHGLTVMSDSWPVPSQDLTAYDRIALGWLTPRVVAETTWGVWLPSAHDTLAAVKIPTARADEYFLIEYRRRPASGYGSINPDFNGLAVYHVLEGSSMWQNPPIMKLEPADESPSLHGLEPTDFLYPGHPGLPMVLRSYYGSGPEIFRIDNVSARDGGLAFDVAVATAPPAAPNLLTNASFETGNVSAGIPDGWTRSASSGFTWPAPIASEGTRSVMLESTLRNDMWWGQSVALELSQSYKLCGWLKGENIQPPGGTGGSMSVIGALGGWVGSPGLVGTFDWTKGCIMFTTDNNTSRADMGCRLGHYLERVSGRLWCDDLTLERLRSAF